MPAVQYVKYSIGDNMCTLLPNGTRHVLQVTDCNVLLQPNINVYIISGIFRCDRLRIVDCGDQETNSVKIL